MIDQQMLQQYFNSSQQLVIESENSDDAYYQLLSLVEKQVQKAEGEESATNFFKGEKAFFNKQYKLALKYYSMAREIPNFRFFCHRATSFVYKKNGKFQEAIDFANKALELHPTDFITLRTLEGLLRKSQQNSLAEIIGRKIDRLLQSNHPKKRIANTQTQSNPLEEWETNEAPQVSIATKELDDLSTLFSDIDKTTTEPERKRNNPYTFLDKESPLKDPFIEELEEKKMVNSLFSSNRNSTSNDSFLFENDSEHSQAMKELERLTKSNDFQPEARTKFPSKETFLEEIEPEQTLEQRVENFQKHQSKLISHYVESSQKREKLNEDFLYILNGWNYQQERELEATGKQTQVSSFLLPEYRRKTCGGFYFRWNGKGIVINPGMHFLENFHHYGLYVKDIDYVIVTRDNMDAFSDVKGIYDLNYQHNSVSNELHVIHYFLNQQAFNNIATSLTPSFKQEQNTVHCLEIYIDSPEVESMQIAEGIRLKYFHSQRERKNGDGLQPTVNNLGIKVELSHGKNQLHDPAPLSIGYLSGIPWSNSLANSLGKCDIVIAGFEKTNADDYSKLRYNHDCLGYYGMHSLVSEAEPKLLLCSEFSGREGDIRVEVVKKLRQELKRSAKVAIIPGDTGLYLNLNNMKMQCSVSKHIVDPKSLRVAKSNESYGHLQYLCPSCFA